MRPKIETRKAPGVQMHVNQLTVSLETVRGLVDDQFPGWRGLAIRSIASQGTVNAIFRADDPGESVAYAHDLAGSSRIYAPSTPEAGHSAARVEAATCSRTTRGWKPASPAMSRMGRRTLERIIADDPST